MTSSTSMCLFLPPWAASARLPEEPSANCKVSDNPGWRLLGADLFARQRFRRRVAWRIRNTGNIFRLGRHRIVQVNCPFRRRWWRRHLLLLGDRHLCCETTEEDGESSADCREGQGVVPSTTSAAAQHEHAAGRLSPRAWHLATPSPSM
jgi:hypothetical protein